MAVSIATDIVMDVVKAAAPEVAEEARSLLQAAAGRRAETSAASGAFIREVASLDDQIAFGLADLRSRLGAGEESDAASGEVPEAYRKFEAMVLGNFVQSMLPSNSEEIFGQGTAGDIWKGMMADKIGQVIAEGRGIGIAERLAARMARNAVPAGELAEDSVNRAANLINELQMAILDDVDRVGDSHSTERKDRA